MLNNVVRVFLTNPVTKRCRRCQFFHSYTSKQNKKEPSGCKLPGVRLLSMINMMETCTNSRTLRPLYKFLNCQKLAWIRIFFTCDPRNREVFELQTVLQSMENLHAPSKRVAQVKKFVRTRGV